MRSPRALRLRRDGDGRWALAGTLLGAVAVAATALGLAVHQFAMSWQPWIVLSAFARLLMLAAPVGVLMFALARRWAALTVAVVATLLVVGSQASLYVGSAHRPAGTQLTMLQANLKVGAADPRAIVRTVSERHVDLAMTEELTPAERDDLVGAGLSRLLPYRFDRSLPGGGGGLAIWSRYPLTAEVDHDHFELGVLSARVSVEGVQATVFAVHLLPPYPYPAAEWSSEISRLRGILGAAGRSGSVIVAGDFNATTDHAQFRNLVRDGYADAAAEVGAGYLATYPTDRWFPPVLAIDHVLVRDVTAAGLFAVDLPGSDHRGLLARLVL